MLPTYLINLDRSNDRLKMIGAQLESLNIEYTRIPAVDGTDIERTAPANYEIGDAHPICKRPLTDGEVACAMSHLIVYEKIVRTKQPYALIIEDDVSLRSDTKRMVEEIMEWNHPEHWDIILLHHTNPSFYKFKTKKINSRLRLARFKRSAGSTAGYIISQSTAKHLLELGQPVRMPADWLTGKRKINRLKICGLLASPFCTVDFPTTIENRPEW